MIAPRWTLLVFALILCLPLATVVGLGFPPVWWLFLALSLLIPIADAALASGKHRQLEFSLPEVVPGIRGRPLFLDVQCSSPDRQTGAVRFALLLPESIEAERNAVPIRIAKGQARHSIRLVGKARGIFSLQELCFDWNSSLHFWVFRRRRKVHSELRIYPDLSVEGRRLARFRHHGAIGTRSTRQVGRGREFEKLREYEPGDSFDEVHWKATAKRRLPVTKVFQLEKCQEVYLALDASRLSGRLTADPFSGALVTHLDRSISAALLFCVAAEKQGDFFGLVSFSDKVRHLVGARAGAAHFNLCRDIAVSLQSQAVSPDFGDIAATLRQRIRRRSLIVFLTSLDDPVLAEEFASAVELLSRRHLVLVIMIAPPNLRPLFEQDSPNSVAAIYERLAGHLRWTKMKDLEQVLRQKGIHFQVVPSERLGLQMVTCYMDLKRRQIL